MSLFVLYGILMGISIICLGLVIFSIRNYFNTLELDRRLRRLEHEKRKLRRRRNQNRNDKKTESK